MLPTEFIAADGRPVDPLRPREVSIEVIASALSKICRFGGHCNYFYSVAEHSIRCCDLAYLMYPDRPIFGRFALLHDIHEVFIGDVTRPMQQYLCRLYEEPHYGMFPVRHETFASLDQRVGRHVRKQFSLDGDLPDEVREIDDLLLAHEMRSLFPSRTSEHPRSSRPLPRQFEREIEPWTHVTAYHLFLQRFDALYLRAQRADGVVEYIARDALTDRGAA